MCGWACDRPGRTPGASCFEVFCWAGGAAGADARVPPAAWEVFVEEALTISSILPSSLPRRDRMSSNSTAIVLFRSAGVCLRRMDKWRGKKKTQGAQLINAFSQPQEKTFSYRSNVTLINCSKSAYHNLPWKFLVGHLVHSGSPLSGP